MARVTIQDVKHTLGFDETYDIVNAIRNSGTDQFQQYVPLANAENVAEVGQGILINQYVQNEFITSLVDRIGLVVIKQVSLQNPLAKFKKGMMPLGSTIEEIFTDITQGHMYDPEDAEETVFKRQIPNVKTLFHKRNRQDYYQQTIQDESLRTAFTSWGNFEGFLASIINAVYNSAEVEEYRYMKLAIDNYYSNGLFKVIPVTKPNSDTASKEFVKNMRATARKMSLPMGSRDYNALAVQTKTDMQDMHLFIDADLEAQIDVDVLARAFNMDKANFLGNVTVIDGFASQGLEAVLVDKEWFMVYDTLQKMETIRNPKGLYWNYYYHVWQIISASRFANAVAFVSGTVDDVTQVIVDPSLSTVKAGHKINFQAFIRQTDKKSYTPSWTVAANDGTSTLKNGTKINNDGVLTVDPNETNELLVTATVTWKEGSGQNATSHDVKGQAIVNVIPE